MRRLLNDLLVFIKYYQVSIVEETKTIKTGQGDYDFEEVGTGKIIRVYSKRKLPF